MAGEEHRILLFLLKQLPFMPLEASSLSNGTYHWNLPSSACSDRKADW